MKYITNIGQKTGMLKTSNIVQLNAIIVDLITEYQNLNSGSRLINGRNSSLAFVGNSGPSPSEVKTNKIKYISSPLEIIKLNVNKIYYHRNPSLDHFSA